MGEKRRGRVYVGLDSTHSYILGSIPRVTGFGRHDVHYLVSLIYSIFNYSSSLSSSFKSNEMQFVHKNVGELM